MAKGLLNSFIAIHSHSPTHSLTDTNVLVNHFYYLTILLNRFINTNPGVYSQKMYSQVKGLNLNILGILAKSKFSFFFLRFSSLFSSVLEIKLRLFWQKSFSKE